MKLAIVTGTILSATVPAERRVANQTEINNWYMKGFDETMPKFNEDMSEAQRPSLTEKKRMGTA